MKNVIKILIGLLMMNCSSQSKILNEHEFTLKYLEEIKKEFPEIKYEIIEPLSVKAILVDKREFSLFLDNAYREYLLEPKDLNAVLDKYIKASSDLYKEDEDIEISKIVPIIKPSDYFENITNEFNEIDLVWEKYNEDLIIVYAEDGDDKVKYFNNEDFKKTNLKKEDLLELSVNNLKEILPEIETIGLIDNHSFGLIAGGVYESSLILMTSIWNKENFDVKGEIIIAIPNRDLNFIMGSEDENSIMALTKTIQENYDTGSYPISTSFYKWDGSKFEKI